MIINNEYKEIQKQKAKYVYLFSNFAKAYKQFFDATQMFDKTLYELHCIAGCKLIIYEFFTNEQCKLKFNLN